MKGCWCRNAKPELDRDTEAETMEEHCFLSRASLFCPFLHPAPSAQGWHLLQRLGPLTLVKKMLPQTFLWVNIMEEFTQLWFPLPR